MMHFQAASFGPGIVAVDLGVLVHYLAVWPVDPGCNDQVRRCVHSGETSQEFTPFV